MLYLILRNPSEISNAVFLGYSTARLFLGGICLFLCGVFIFLFIRSIQNDLWINKFDNRIHHYLFKKNRSKYIPVVLTILILGLLTAIILYNPISEKIINDLPYSLPGYSIDENIQQAVLMPFAIRVVKFWTLLNPIISKLIPILIWFLLIFVQGLVIYSLLYKSLSSRERQTKKSHIPQVCLILLIFFLTVFHWLTLILRLKTLLYIRGWKWYFWQKELQPNLWIFMLILIAIMGITWFIIKRQPKLWLSLTLIIVLGYGLQVGFGAISGTCFNSLKEEYASSVFNYYAIEAAQESDLIETLQQYEVRYGPKGYLGTKPPGVHVFYIAIQRLSDILLPADSPEQRFKNATTLMAYLFPLLAMMVLIPLTVLSRQLNPDRTTRDLPGLLYIVCPNIALITLFLDQALYPLLFVCGLLITYTSMCRNSLPMSLLLGVYLYTISYFGFSLLPLIPLVFLWSSIDYLTHRKERSILDTILQFCAILIGIIAAYLLFKWLLYYDFFPRYRRAFEYHREIKSFEPGLAMIGHIILLNNAEFFTWTGIPIILLFISNLISGVKALFQHKAETKEGLLLAFSALYAGVVIFGQTFGEVQRLYIFLIPVVVIFASQEISYRFKHKRPAFMVIVLLQLITTLLLYIFQDYYA